MNKPLTFLSWPVARPACLAAGVAVLHLLGTPAHAQILALNSVRQSAPAEAPRTARAPKSVLLKTLLKQWESEYHATIFYESNVVENKRVVEQGTTASGSLADKLAAVLPQVSLQFKELRTNYFVVVNAPVMAGFAAPTSSAGAVQDIGVTGRVTGTNGEPLPGVTVLVKGTTNGTATDANGNFSLTVPENSTLVFSSVGFLRQEVAVGTTTTFTINLKEDTQSLKEVVVVGYGTQSRQELTTAVSSVGAAAIERQPVASFDQALQGQAPGVQVTAGSGAPGGAINVRIRGAASINLSGSPLYVIDGIPILPNYEQEINNNNQRLNPLTSLNPNDIERIDVLKDGAAQAIYGLRAANGVVVITTKRGKVGTAQVSLNAYYGRQYLRKKLDVLNGQQFAKEYNEILSNANPAQQPKYPDPTNPINSDPANPGPYNTDWQDAIFRPASQQNYQLNVSGGTDKTRYYIGGGYFQQSGININSGFDRYNFKINLDQQLSSRFRVGTSLNTSRTHTNGSVRSEASLGNSGTVLGALTQIPTIPIYKADGTYGTNPFTLSDNPVGNLLETSNQAVVYQLQNNLYAEFDVLKDLTLRSTFGIDFRNSNENAFYSTNYPGTAASDPSTKGSATVGTSQALSWINENVLTYTKTFGDKHHLTLLGGESMQSYDRRTSGGATQGFSFNIPYLSAGATTRTKPYSYEEQWALLSFYSRAIYNYDERYLATVSFRADASSRFAAQNRFGYFPAASLGWHVSRENFFPQSKAVSDLKVRVSFGAVGNQEIPIYSRFSTYDLGYGYQQGGTTTPIIASGGSTNVIGNNVKWETTHQYDAGLDVGLLSNRVTLTFDIYKKHTTDLLYQVTIPQSTGAGSLQVIQNIGTIDNKGIEIGVVTTNVEAQNGGFGWTTNFNITGNRNMVVDIGTQANAAGVQVPRTDPSSGYNILQAGSPLGVFYGYQVLGIVQSDADGASVPKQNGYTPKAGDLRFQDTNGDGKVDGSDRIVIGNPNPKAFLGFTNNFSYKGVELSVFFQSSLGNDIYNQNRTITEGQTTALNQSAAVLNHWTLTNTNTNIPRPVFGDPNGNNNVSTRFIEDGSYVRLKNLTVAYNVPVSLSKRAAIKNLRVYATALNLVTWTKYSGYDPEVAADPLSNTALGRDYGVYPQARTYTVGLNATF